MYIVKYEKKADRDPMKVSECEEHHNELAEVYLLLKFIAHEKTMDLISVTRSEA